MESFGFVLMGFVLCCVVYVYHGTLERGVLVVLRVVNGMLSIIDMVGFKGYYVVYSLAQHGFRTFNILLYLTPGREGFKYSLSKKVLVELTLLYGT